MLRHIAVGKSGDSSNRIENCYYVEGNTYADGSTIDAFRGAAATETVLEKPLAFFMGDTEIAWANWTEREGDIIIPSGVASFAPALYAMKYTVTWVNDDGTVIATEEYDGGAMPEYKGETPTKADDDKYTYTFSNWSPAIVAVTANATYKAEFFKTRKSVNIGDEEEGGNNTTDTTPTTPETSAQTTAAPAPSEDKGGCGSVIGGGAVAIVAVIGSAVVLGKKKED